MSTTNVSLSAQELELVSNPSWILMKRSIIDKLYYLFGDMIGEIDRNMGAQFSQFEVPAISPKISKGESYRMLPYVVLDYPRNFNGEDVFSLRTFFWWGHFFSISLHLGGKYKARVIENLLLRGKEIPSGYYVCVNNTPWEHHFEPDNFIPIADMNNEQLLGFAQKHSFLKIAKKIPLSHWHEISDMLINEYRVIAGLLD